MTFYLFDIADTLIDEAWDPRRSGYPSFERYVEVRYGKPIAQVTPLEYELAYERPYREEWFKLRLAPDIQEVLRELPYHGVFTSGVREQVSWRAEPLANAHGVRVSELLGEVMSTFDYEQTNVKTVGMFQEIINSKLAAGFDRIVYVDDKHEHCLSFLRAGATSVAGVFPKLGGYHLNPDPCQLEKDAVSHALSLRDLVQHEQVLCRAALN